MARDPRFLARAVARRSPLFRFRRRATKRRAPQAYRARAHSQQALGRHELAISDLDRAIELEPCNAVAWYNRAISLSRLGRGADAVAGMDRAIALTESGRDTEPLPNIYIARRARDQVAGER